MENRRPSLEEIANESSKGLARNRLPHFKDIGLTSFFVPESFTQLFHTPAYNELNVTQRLRYNQLYGLRSNELFMLFEEGFTRRVISCVMAICAQKDTRFYECLAQMLQEESNHHQMFLAFNREILPAAYADGLGYFARPRYSESVLLRLATGSSVHWPFLLWLILILEEFSTAFSQLLVERESADRLSTAFVTIHRLHLLDESRHVLLDEELIDRFVAPMSRTRKRINGWLFRHLFQAILAPKRSGIRVLEALVVDHPELTSALPRLKAAVRSLRHDPGMLKTVCDRSKMPLTYRLLDRYPEFMPDVLGHREFTNTKS